MGAAEKVKKEVENRMQEYGERTEEAAGTVREVGNSSR